MPYFFSKPLSRFLIFILLAGLLSCSRKIIPERPELTRTEFILDSLPESEINLPVLVNLRPIYQMIEKKVDTVFTSPNWPNDWVEADCATRYKYHFRRGPLRFTATGTSLSIGFTGFYRIIGSTRACIGSAVVSPWTPPCRCGFDEGERRVQVQFTSQVLVTPDYKLNIRINRNEPVATDKCTVCFFGADITSQVMNGLKEELDLAKAEMEKTIGTIDLKDQVQQLWDQMSASYHVDGKGWFRMNPKKIRLNSLFARNDSLYIFLGLTANPLVRFDKPQHLRTVVPNLDFSLPRAGFNIFLDALLNYDSLSRILNGQFRGKEFSYQKGPLNKTVVIRDCSLYGMDNERLIIRLEFGGSNEGVIYFTGKPVYNHQDYRLEVRDIDFDLKTKNMLMRTAEWMFNRRIINELMDYTKFDLKSYIDSAKTMISEQLNRDWLPGISSSGQIDELSIISIFPLSNQLFIRGYAQGNLLLKLDASAVSY